MKYEEVLIYTNKNSWITIDQVRMAADTTKSLLEAEKIQVMMLRSENEYNRILVMEV